MQIKKATVLSRICGLFEKLKSFDYLQNFPLAHRIEADHLMRTARLTGECADKLIMALDCLIAEQLSSRMFNRIIFTWFK